MRPAALGRRLGGLQATTVAHRVRRLVRRAGVPGAPLVPGAPPASTPTPAATPATVAGVDLPPDVAGRALAASGLPGAVAGLADVWRTLTPSERGQVARPLGTGTAGPLRIGGAPARQTDATTCGSAALVLLAAAGDPLLALWLVTGRLVVPRPVAGGPARAYLPPELRGLTPHFLDAADAGAAARFALVQRAVKRSSTRRALGPLPWPGALGTPPWGAARTARFPGVRYASVLVDDTDRDRLATVLDLADAALAAGVPVPLYTGGDLALGIATAVPRHVVLLVPSGGSGYAVYEPGSGRVHPVTRAQVLAPAGPRAAWGGWSHVCWAVLPRVAQEAAVPPRL